MIILLFWLIVGHAVADFALQPDVMAKGKNRHNRTDQPCWMYWLSAHALIHGGAVALATGIWWLGVAETVWHWGIDFGKCDNVIDVHIDQALHLFCKMLWWVIAVWMLT